MLLLYRCRCATNAVDTYRSVHKAPCLGGEEIGFLGGISSANGFEARARTAPSLKQRGRWTAPSPLQPPDFVKASVLRIYP